MKIQEYLEKNKIICDGAFGTYCMTMNHNIKVPERANLEAPELVYQIHKEYLEAGANLIRTNTFAIQQEVFQEEKEILKQYIQQGFYIAQKAAKEVRKKTAREIYVGGDIGPLPALGGAADEGNEFYEWTARILLEAGAEILIFETFPDMEAIRPVIQKLKAEYNPFIIVQFCLNQYGYSSTGASAQQLFRQAAEMEEIDAVGLNCGNGPGHTLHILQSVSLPEKKYITALPNASYPKVSRNRVVYQENISYFVEKMQEISNLGIDMLGGCCGTTPAYIQEMVQTIKREQNPRKNESLLEEQKEKGREKQSAFYQKKEKWQEREPSSNYSEKLIAAELTPPENIQIQKLLDAAYALKVQNVDIITFPDSPSGRTRIDSITTAIRVFRETGMKVMPHICCRDKNSIAMMAQLMGAYINEIRNFLVVTGDPVPEVSRTQIKGVFNYNAVGVMQILKEMNENYFQKDPVCYGGALNCGAPNLAAEIKKTHRKLEAGADFFLTQPIFNQSEIENLKIVKKETGARILCGLMPLVSFRNARFIQNEIMGINVTDEIVHQFEPDMPKQEAEEVGIKICQNVVRQTWNDADGYYFSIPFYRAHLVGEVMKVAEDF